MKNVKGLKGLFVFSVLVALVVIPLKVNADTCGGNCNQMSAYLSAINVDDTISVDIKWGPLSYEYNRYPDAVDSWSPTSYYSGNVDGNYVVVTNRSTKGVTASLSWYPTIRSIRMIDAEFDYVTKTEGRGVCVNAEQWLIAAKFDSTYMGYRTVTAPEDYKLYTDNECNSEVVNNAAYDENATYYTVKLTSSNKTYSNRTYISPVINKNSFGITPVGSQYNNNTLANIAEFHMNLKGGNYDDIQNAFNNNERKIGVVTVTISD